MQHQRGELVPISEAVSGLDDEMAKALRDATRQSRHHFTQADQVNQLVSASEVDADLGFMAQLLALCSLPRTNPGTPAPLQTRQWPTPKLRRPANTSPQTGRAGRSCSPGPSRCVDRSWRSPESNLSGRTL